MYHVLSSQIKVEYTEDHEGKKDSIKVDRRRSRKRSRNVKPTKSVKLNEKEAIKLRSGIKVGKRQMKGNQKCKVKIEPEFNEGEGYKSDINEKSKKVK